MPSRDGNSSYRMREGGEARAARCHHVVQRCAYCQSPPQKKCARWICVNFGTIGRMLHKVGVLSYSEPYWLEVICQLGLEGFDKQMIVQVSIIPTKPPRSPSRCFGH